MEWTGIQTYYLLYCIGDDTPFNALFQICVIRFLTLFQNAEVSCEKTEMR